MSVPLGSGAFRLAGKCLVVPLYCPVCKEYLRVGDVVKGAKSTAGKRVLVHYECLKQRRMDDMATRAHS